MTHESEIRLPHPRRLPFLGIAPGLVIVAFLFFSNGVILSLDHTYFRWVLVSRKVDENVGLVLFLMGVLVWVGTVIVYVPGWLKQTLLVKGPYRLCRHPMYASLILFILPALGLIAHSWLEMSTVAVVWVAFKWWIPREDKRLVERFGAEYQAYRARTHELIPWFK